MIDEVLSKAAELDAEEYPAEAAEAYEKAIADGDAGLQTYLDLAALYFESNDLGYASAHHLSDEFINRASERFFELLAEAKEKFGSHSEIEFWASYFRFVHHGANLKAPAVERIANKEESLVPYLFLFDPVRNADKYRQEAEALFRSVSRRATARERYIYSILETKLGDGAKIN